MKAIVRAALCLSMIMGGASLYAQTHYPTGVEGIKAASLPPPGVYFRDYNFVYSTSQSTPSGVNAWDLVAYAQVPRLILITDKKVLGGYYGLDVIVPIMYQDFTTGIAGQSKLGIGDIFVEPITLSWHFNKMDLSFGYGVWMPTGDFQATVPVSPGKGFWGQMLTGGITYYPDKDKTWSITALHRYEFNHERDQTKVTPGQYWTVEGGVAKTFGKMDLGVVGYVQAQTTLIKGANSTTKDSIAAVGPEITFPLPQKFSASVRYLREVGASLSKEPKGNVFNVTFTKRLGGPAAK